MVEVAIVDADVLVASADRSSRDHRICLDALVNAEGLVIPALCVAEASYLIQRDLGMDAELAFLRGLSDFEVLAPDAADWTRVAEIVEEYRDFKLGGTDASIVALAEQLGTDAIITLDHGHFRAIKPRHCEFFRLLPEF